MSEATIGRAQFPGLKDQFTTRAWVLIPVGVGINIVGGVLVNVLRLPVFLDVIGTLLVAVLAGPWVGALAGVITNLVLGVTTNPVWFPFLITNAAIGLAAGWLAKRGFMRSWPKAIVMGILIMLVAVATSVPISVFLFGGVTGTGSSAVTAFFLATGRDLLESVFTSQVIVESADKILSVLVAFVIARSVPARYRPRFGRAALRD